jgi:L-ascorbate metabolism protein UlaG (beta-lactamase superfamily)
MDVRFLGCAGLEVRAQGAALLIDPLGDPAYEYFREAVAGTTVPPSGPAGAALVTHLHRDHADAAALAAALPDGAPVLAPETAPVADRPTLANVAVFEAEVALARGPFALRRVRPWESVELGPFTATAVPAVDGTGEEQVSWVVEADGARILHGGDTVWHGFWWAIAARLGPIDCAFLPANGVLVDFPHRQPAVSVPAALTPEQAVEAARALQAGRLVPIHYGTYSHERMYREREDVPGAVSRTAAERGVRAEILELGQVTKVSAAAAV